MRRLVLLSLPLAALAFAALACGPTTPTSEPSTQPLGQPPGRGGGPPVAESPGQAVFGAQKCGNCHALTAGGPGKAPELSKAGAKHDKAWIADHIRDATKHSPISNMPPYPADKLNDKDLDTLAEFLAGKK